MSFMFVIIKCSVQEEQRQWIAPFTEPLAGCACDHTALLLSEAPKWT